MKVLVIDDEPHVLKQLEKVLSTEKDPQGQPYEVTAAADHGAALRRLDEERFDVVVTDMYMGPEEDEGLIILRELAEKSPITIVLTAYPKIPNCVASIRAGARDYLEKNPEDGSDAYDNLIKSIRQACRERLHHPEQGRSAADARWVHGNIGELMKDYPGEVVAVLDEEVVDHDKSFDELSERVKAKYPLAKPALVDIPDGSVNTI
jgi:DNA-binding NtrC family response regulator